VGAPFGRSRRLPIIMIPKLCNALKFFTSASAVKFISRIIPHRSHVGTKNICRSNYPAKQKITRTPRVHRIPSRLKPEISNSGINCRMKHRSAEIIESSPIVPKLLCFLFIFLSEAMIAKGAKTYSGPPRWAREEFHSRQLCWLPKIKRSNWATG